MRIGLEMSGTQTAGRGRGVGRYSRNLASALAARPRWPDYGHGLILYADASLPDDAVPRFPHVPLRHLQPNPNPRDALDRLVRENPDDLDALVIANPLELAPGHDPPARPAGGKRPLLAAVVHDLIPLLFPEDYLRRWTCPGQARRYLWALERLRQYDALLTNSEATRCDVLRLLNVPTGKVVSVGTGGDDLGAAFSPRTDGDGNEEDARDLAAVRRLGLGGPFVFAVAATDPRKNLEGLLNAFARLPAPVLASHKLAVAAGIGELDPEAAPVLRLAGSLGLGGRLVLTGPVDDAALRALYRRAGVFVFPSRYEGFGLPVLEALRCGAAVVAGDNSSLPEAAGDAALLVNTDDPDALAAAIARLLTDDGLARSLRSRGPSHASAFTWDRVAARTLSALEAAAGGAAGQTPRPCRAKPGRPRVAFFSPLPPHDSGVANYAEALLPHLAEYAEIDLYHDAGEAPFARFRHRGSGCHDYRAFPRIDRARPYDEVVYQMGNSPSHSFAYETLLTRPGVVALHDLALASFHYERAGRGGGGLGAFRTALEHAHPGRAAEYGPLLAGRADAPGAMIAALTDRGFDMNRAVVTAARAVIVHSESAALRLGPGAAGNVSVVPLGAEAAARPLSPEARAAARLSLGLPRDALVFGRFGIVHPSKLDAEAVEAVAAVPGALLLVVGAEADGGLARRRAGELGAGDRVRFWGRPDDPTFRTLIEATDVGLALRRPPTNGESSAALLDLLRAGVATVVTDVGSFAEFPESVVRKVAWPPDGSGPGALRRVLTDLAASPVARDALGVSAREFVRGRHAWPRVARLYAEVIAGPRPVYRGPHEAARRRVGR